ncbi:unnamed protein product [Effrenium voratum]|nr:unnamed protein product [Effrenium voratum]
MLGPRERLMKAWKAVGPHPPPPRLRPWTQRGSERGAMKRAAAWLFGSEEDRQRELLVGEVLQRLKQDHSSVQGDLLELPQFRKPEALLAHMRRKQLSEGDAEWMELLSLALEKRTQDDLKRLTILMAKKRQFFEYLVQHFQALHVQHTLDDMDLDAVLQLYQVSKQGPSDVSSSKRRRMSRASAGPGACGPVGLIAENLQKKLEVEMEHESSRAGTICLLRDVVVHRYQMLPNEAHITRLVDLIESFGRDMDLEPWAETADLAVLQQVLGRGTAAESLGAVAAVVGRRCLAAGQALAAAAAYRQHWQWTKEPSARGKLLEVLLTCLEEGHECLDDGEVVALLSAEHRWDTLVELRSRLSLAGREFTETQLPLLAEALLGAGEVQEGSGFLVRLACHLEAKGRKKEALSHFRKAFAVDPDNMESQEGMCRLAVDCGCVQDAATELILPVLKFDTAQAALVAERLRRAFSLLTKHTDRAVRRASAPCAPAPGTPGTPAPTPTEAEKEGYSTPAPGPRMVYRAVRRASAPCAPAPGTPGTPVPSESEKGGYSTPVMPVYDSLLASLVGEDKSETSQSQSIGSSFLPSVHSWTQQVPKLRERYPDKVPAVCFPALDPNEEPSPEVMKPVKFLLPKETTCTALKRSLQRKLADVPEQGLRSILGCGSEVSKPIHHAETAGALFERHQKDQCLQLRFTADHIAGRPRLELFLA